MVAVVRLQVLDEWVVMVAGRVAVKRVVSAVVSLPESRPTTRVVVGKSGCLVQRRWLARKHSVNLTGDSPASLPMPSSSTLCDQRLLPCDAELSDDESTATKHTLIPLVHACGILY